MAITYAPTTNFGLKDSLPTNDSDKVIRGSEFTTEFTAIQTAFSLAAPNASPTFTGTVTIPTADINGGNIDGTVIGAATPAAGSFTTLTASGNLSVDGGTIKLDGNYPVGTGNVALGDTALDDGSLSGSYNTAIGNQALTANTTGQRNTALGSFSFLSNTTGNYNTGLGYESLGSNTSGANNVAVGYQALDLNTTASNNTAVGYQAGYANTTGTRNTVLGSGGLFDNTTGNNNTAIGWNVLANNTTASHNVGIGAGDGATYNPALAANTTGQYNTAVGNGSLGSNTTASNNTAVGYQAGYANTTGAANAFIGYQAGLANTTGSQNSYLGYFAGGAMTTGSNNTIVGRFTGNQGGLDIRTSSNNIVLSDGDGNPRGYYDGGVTYPQWNLKSPTNDQWAMELQNTGSVTPYGQKIKFPNTAPNDVTRRFLQGEDSVTVRFIIYSNGNIVNANNSYGAISDEKLKENIVDSSSQWDDIKALRVRKYSMKADALDAPNRLGVIAQEVEAAGMGGLVFETPDIDAETKEELGTVTKQVNYSILYMKAVKALQEAMERIENLEAEVAALKGA